ncbi:tRNA pseudouridine(55) synthase TruB [Alphaproteobacteria bacterium]|nr:tRNA pseudouridine(55) synthase TruB [Alphaproteobacteria bacterium]
MALNNSIGWLNIYKEQGITSTEVLRRLKRKFSFKKIGHHGTLDPLASGVLPVALGEATKTINYITNNYKKYSFVIKWGEETDSCDAEGKVIKTSPNRPIIKDINATIDKEFIGDIMQKPPSFSAIKINGKRAYLLARQNIDFEIKEKKIQILDFKLQENVKNYYSKFVIKCGPGTYVRSIARDLAHRLGTFGYALDIVRIESGRFSKKSSIKLEKLLDFNIEELNKLILPLDFALDNYPEIKIEKKYSDMLKDGKVVYIKQYKSVVDDRFFLIKSGGKLVSIANFKKGYIIPRRNFVN